MVSYAYLYSTPFWLNKVNVPFEENYSGTFFYLYQMDMLKK